MKYNLDGVLIVEGKEDVSYLSSFISSNFFTTNGYDLSEEKIYFLKEVSKVNKLFVMTDNDAAGEVIENRLTSQINGCFVIKISGKSRKNYKKNGVAESNRDEIVNLLKPFFTDKTFEKTNYNLSRYLSFNKSGLKTKSDFIKKYRLINGNNKYLESQLNMLKISKDEIDNYFKV